MTQMAEHRNIWAALCVHTHVVGEGSTVSKTHNRKLPQLLKLLLAVHSLNGIEFCSICYIPSVFVFFLRVNIQNIQQLV